MRPQDSEFVTEPVGRFGVRLVGFRNPSLFLKRTAINRNEAERNMVGRKIDLIIPAELLHFVSGPARNPKGSGKKIFDDPYLQVTPKLEVKYRTQEYLDKKTGLPKVYMKKGVEKSGAAHDKVFPFESTSLFSKTSKMSAPSFSLPAGPTSIGGTCAAADIDKRPKVYEVALGQGDVEQAPAMAKKWICNFCYSGKSNYMHRTSQYGQTARKIWLDGMLAAHDIEGTADAMAGALAAHLGNVGARASMKESSDFFRIHDSGDLIPATYLMWRLIATDPRVSRVKFWCPTRAWVFPRFGDVVRKNPPPENMTLRPSALHFGDQAPLVDGFDAGSTAHPAAMDPVEEKKADWNCPAYNHGGKSCAGAGGPSGEKDCRVCWTYKDMRPSYRSH